MPVEHTSRTARDRVKLAPKPLPAPRPRALTCPLPKITTGRVISQTKPSRWWNPLSKPTQAQLRQCTLTQSQSSLLTRLPREIRQQIFADVLGGHWLHLVRAPNRLLAIKCAQEPAVDAHANTATTCDHGCWGVNREIHLGTTPGFYSGPRHDSVAAAANLLPLLLTCRLV